MHAADKRTIDTWLKSKRSPNTRRAYALSATRFMALIDKRLAAVLLTDIDDFLDLLVDEEQSCRSRARHMAAIMNLLRFARLSNLADEFMLPKVPTHLATDALNSETVQQMIDREPDDRNRALLILFYVDALIPAKVRFLRWSEVSALSAKAQAILAKLPQRDDYVFPGRNRRTPLGDRQMRRIVRTAGERVGQTVNPRILRRSHPPHAAKKGAPFQTIQVGMGHKHASSTQKYFSSARHSSKDFI